MIGARARSLLVTAAVAGVLFYGFAGHALQQRASHEDMAGAAIGLCMLLVTVTGLLAIPRPQVRLAHAVAALPAPTSAHPLPAAPDGRARASPTALQRFRN